MSLSLPFFLYKHKNTLIPKEGTSVCQTRGSTQIPATSSDGSFCRNAAIRYRLLSFTNTAQKAVSSFFVPGRSQPCLPFLYGRLKCLMSLSLQILYPKNFLLLYINFPKKFFKKNQNEKIGVHSCPVFSSSVR
ncbi:hypothetical protein CU084_10150 [Bacillus velezensis]|nr:hypothetical protein CU084_10150 [Bacillus velezensis]